MITKNAFITSATLTIEHGVLSGWVYLDYGGAGQGFGGYCLYNPEAKRDPTADIGGQWVKSIMDVVGVEKWDNLKGKPVRAIMEDASYGALVIGIANFVSDDKTFIPKELWK